MFSSKKNCYIIVGHYGSGKTEIADNLAVRFASQGAETVIADLDIVNPYFRTRECQEELNALGVTVISSNFANNPYEDTPGLSPEIMSCFVKSDRTNIIDVGGDPAGARVLGRYRNYICDNYEMWFVVNKNRYYTGTALAGLEFLKDIEAVSGLKITGLINNTNSCEETTVEDIISGDEMVRELSQITGIPVVGSTYIKNLESEMSEKSVAGEKMILNLMHRPGWMKYT